MLSMCHVRTIHWGMGNLPLATALKKKRFSVPQQPSNLPIALQLGLGPLLPLHSFLFRTWSPPKIGRLWKHYQGQGSWCLPRDSLTHLHVCFIKLGISEEERVKWLLLLSVTSESLKTMKYCSKHFQSKQFISRILVAAKLLIKGQCRINPVLNIQGIKNTIHMFFLRQP